MQDIALISHGERRFDYGKTRISPLGMAGCVSAGLNIVWGWQLRCADVTRERKVARWVVLVSCVAMIADLVSGYYGFGSLMALLTGVWLMMKHTKISEK